MALYYRDSSNNYIGAFEGDTKAVPAGAIQVPTPPKDGRMKWDGSQWVEPAPLKDTFVDERRKLALLQAGVNLEQRVDALWLLATGDKTEFDRIQAIVAQIEIDNPKV